MANRSEGARWSGCGDGASGWRPCHPDAAASAGDDRAEAYRAFVVMQQDDQAAGFPRKAPHRAGANANPDGVDKGHWRLNDGGVDLNRDWGPFTQPETGMSNGY
jgi:hypothetical protein